MLLFMKTKHYLGIPLYSTNGVGRKADVIALTCHRLLQNGLVACVDKNDTQSATDFQPLPWWRQRLAKPCCLNE